MKPKCIIDGCNNNCMSRGYGKYHNLCTKHHKAKYRMKNPIGKKIGFDTLDISNQPCALCGWNKSFCDRHRLKQGKDGGKYIKGNVVPLCPNCHRVEHNKDLNVKVLAISPRD
jgi:hypothetical protein